MKKNCESMHAPAFIPCGDSMEKMDEIREEKLEEVTGGKKGGCEADRLQNDTIKNETMLIIPLGWEETP